MPMTEAQRITMRRFKRLDEIRDIPNVTVPVMTEAMDGNVQPSAKQTLWELHNKCKAIIARGGLSAAAADYLNSKK